MNIFRSIFALFFPAICLSCENVLTKQELIICSFCNYELPKTEYTNIHDNLLERTFYGRVRIEEATALLFYNRKGIVQRLIHNLKYKGHEEVGSLLGKWLGNEMYGSDRFGSLDFVVPVPLHKKKLRTRGYNQVTKFAKEIANTLQIPLKENILIRKNTSKTQSKKIRLDRWKNVEEMFFVNDLSVFENKHILLVDDIITTGSTIETCCNELYNVKNIKISVAVMAFTN